MVRLSDLSAFERDHLLEKTCEPFETTPWAKAKPLRESRVALITTAGLHHVDDDAFGMMDVSYRVIPGDTPANKLTMSHSSVHFDRSGFREDTNLVLPLDRLRELVKEGIVGAIANFHYSLMGAGWLPQKVEPTINELAKLLRRDNVDAACIIPV
jgi:D-proline reductase (dithiol) PrdB